MPNRQPMILPAASVIIVDREGRILLQHRRDNNYWGIPGGAMELGESFEETARREVFEETGLVLGKLELLCLNSGKDTFYEYPDGNQVYMAGVIFKTTDFTGDLRADDNESLGVEWFELANIPPILSPLQRPILQFYMSHPCEIEPYEPSE